MPSKAGRQAGIHVAGACSHSRHKNQQASNATHLIHVEACPAPAPWANTSNTFESLRKVALGSFFPGVSARAGEGGSDDLPGAESVEAEAFAPPRAPPRRLRVDLVVAVGTSRVRLRVDLVVAVAASRRLRLVGRVPRCCVTPAAFPRERGNSLPSRRSPQCSTTDNTASLCLARRACDAIRAERRRGGGDDMIVARGVGVTQAVRGL